MRVLLVLLLWCLGPALSSLAQAEPSSYPMYKPSGRSPAPLNIMQEPYGASRSAPNALKIGGIAPDFTLPRAGGGDVHLRDLLASGPVALIFYRGHW